MTAHSLHSDPVALKALAVQVALEAGAGAVRVTPAFADEATRARMLASFERGDLSSWGYGDEYAQKASDPQAVLASARTVICMAFPYATPSPEPDGLLRGRVSNYAWSSDYHKRIKAILRRVKMALDEAAGEEVAAITCDTAPLAERAFAANSGIGWVGKHTNLISPELGSFIFLGEVITTLDLPHDTPLKKQCGTCSLCVTACPTGALRGDYTIDATRCISDLTQRVDSIPVEMRALIGTWIWGCDLCQAVCPPTAMASPAVPVENAPHSSESAQPGLIALLELKSSVYERVYRGTAMGWRGGAVLRRNAAVALGNALDRSTVPALAQALDVDPHPMVRGHVAWALGRIGSPEAIEALQSQARVETEMSVCLEIAGALTRCAGDGR